MAAFWEMLEAFEVDCPWMVLIAVMISFGPPQYPSRQPVMAYALETPLMVTVRW